MLAREKAILSVFRKSCHIIQGEIEVVPTARRPNFILFHNLQASLLTSKASIIRVTVISLQGSCIYFDTHCIFGFWILLSRVWAMQPSRCCPVDSVYNFCWASKGASKHDCSNRQIVFQICKINVAGRQTYLSQIKFYV